MTEADLLRIETELGIGLPSKYRSTMLAYPFGAQSKPAQGPIPDSAEKVINLNRDFQQRATRKRRSRKPNYFIFGDSYGDYFCIDLAKPKSPVYRLEFRKLKSSVDAKSFAAWVRLRIKWYVNVDREARGKKYARLRAALGRASYEVSNLELMDGWDRVRCDSYFWVGRIKRKWYVCWWMGLGFRLERGDQLVDFCLAAIDESTPTEEQAFVRFMKKKFEVTTITDEDLDAVERTIKT
jgi:hypothetical protein